MAGTLDKLKICIRCNTCLMRCQTGIGPGCPFNPELGREYANPAYMIGTRQKHESIMPEGLMRKDMPPLERPWWQPEVKYLEKTWRKYGPK